MTDAGDGAAAPELFEVAQTWRGRRPRARGDIENGVNMNGPGPSVSRHITIGQQGQRASRTHRGLEERRHLAGRGVQDRFVVRPPCTARDGP